MNLKHALLAGLLVCSAAADVTAQLAITSGWDSSAAVAPTLLLSDFANNPSGYWTAQLGTNTATIGGANRWQGNFGGKAGWAAGANTFVYTYDPTAGLETYTNNNSAGQQGLAYTTAFNKTINYIQFDLSARKGLTALDAFSVSGLTITSLNGASTYLLPATLSVGNNGGYLNYQIQDNTGVLANGFILSGTLNLTSPANYTANQNDKFVVTLGNDASISSPSPVPEPSAMALGLSALLPLGRMLRRKPGRN